MEWLKTQYERGTRAVTLMLAGLGVLFLLQVTELVSFTYVAVPEGYEELSSPTQKARK